MYRRAFLGSAAALGAAPLAGCSGGDANGDVVLPEPDRQFDSSDVPYPAWGERVPDVTLPAALGSGTVSLRDVERPTVLTFFYSHCNSVCPVLISALQSVQEHSIENGYADAVQFLPTTFDPERDDADRLQAYATDRNVALDAGNWQFLRPASPERAQAVVGDQFGVAFERTHPEDMDTYMFAHTALTLLVNADGYVERAYRTQSPDPTRLVDDLQTVRTA